MKSVYQAARERVVWLDRTHRGRIVVSGVDRRSYLHGLFTNDITALQAGRGCYSAYLTPQGRMIADLWVYELGDVTLLNVVGDVKDTVLTKLDQFVFTEDVQLGDVTSTFSQIAMVGPDAADVVASMIEGTSAQSLRELPEHGNLRAQMDGQSLIVARVTDPGEPGFDLYVEQAGLASLTERLRSSAIPELDERTAEVLRVEAGLPLFHRDMDEETIPLEAGIETRAISFTKGCYVGQEVIIRVLHRGHGRIAKKLVGLTLDGSSIAAPGTVVQSGDREIGRVTSSVESIALGRPIALAYLHREFLAPGTPVTVANVSGAVADLPFVSRQAID